MASVGKLTRLKHLRLVGAFGDADVAHLAGLTSLRSLMLRSSGPGFTDRGLSHLAKMNTLADLHLKGDFTAGGLRQLEELKALRWLKIYSPNDLSPAALERLWRKLPNLETLEAPKAPS